MLESFETGRNFDFQMERNTNQLARGAFLLFKTPSFWTYDNETTRHTLDDFLQRSRPQGRGGREMNNLLEDLKARTEERDMEKKKVLWLAQQCAASGWCPFSADKASCDYRTTQNVEGMCLCMDANKTTSCWDQAAEEKAKR